MNNAKNMIETAIVNLINDFKNYPDKYLTESDVRCSLVNELMKNPEFNKIQNTEDNSKSIPLHTEVRWYGHSGRLKWRSDIVIIDVNSLRVKRDIFRLPSKGFGFNKPKAIIEIKLRRINGESNSAFISKIKQDINRLNRIRAEIVGNYFCGLVILDKKENIVQEITAIENNIELYYQAV